MNNAKPGRLPPRRSNALRVHIRDLNRDPIDHYTTRLRERDHLLSLGRVDVDLEQLVYRPFLCDRHRCIQWTPHEVKAEARPLIDRSCCSRYTVPITEDDRARVMAILPLVRKRLAKSHPFVADEALEPYTIDDDFSLALREKDSGACEFVLYDKGLTTCAIHKTCLEEGLDVWSYKPVGCSLWPLALVDYRDPDDKERVLLTAYSKETSTLFAGDEDDVDEDDFACLVDEDPRYEPLYRSHEGVLTAVIGAEAYKRLDRVARQLLDAKKRNGRRRRPPAQPSL
jgi:hypothetical protein